MLRKLNSDKKSSALRCKHARELNVNAYTTHRLDLYVYKCVLVGDGSGFEA